MGLSRHGVKVPLLSHRTCGQAVDSYSAIIKSNWRVRKPKLSFWDQERNARLKLFLIQTVPGNKRRMNTKNMDKKSLPSLSKKRTKRNTYRVFDEDVLETRNSATKITLRKKMFSWKKEKKIDNNVDLLFVGGDVMTELGTTSLNNFMIYAENDDEIAPKKEEERNKKVIEDACELNLGLEEKLAGKGVESPFLEVVEIFPSFQDLHLNLGIGINRSVASCTGKKLPSVKDKGLDSISLRESSTAPNQNQVVQDISERTMRSVTSFVSLNFEEKVDRSTRGKSVDPKVEHNQKHREHEYSKSEENASRSLHGCDVGTASELNRVKERLEDVPFVANYMYSVSNKQAIGHKQAIKTKLHPTSLCDHNRRIESEFLTYLLQNGVQNLDTSEPFRAHNYNRTTRRSSMSSVMTDVAVFAEPTAVTMRGTRILDEDGGAIMSTQCKRQKRASISSVRTDIAIIVDRQPPYKILTDINCSGTTVNDELLGTTIEIMQDNPPQTTIVFPVTTNTETVDKLPNEDVIGKRPENQAKIMTRDKVPGTKISAKCETQKRRSSILSTVTHSAVVDGLLPSENMESCPEHMIGTIVCDGAPRLKVTQCLDAQKQNLILSTSPCTQKLSLISSVMTHKANVDEVLLPREYIIRVPRNFPVNQFATCA